MTHRNHFPETSSDVHDLNTKVFCLKNVLKDEKFPMIDFPSVICTKCTAEKHNIVLGQFKLPGCEERALKHKNTTVKKQYERNKKKNGCSDGMQVPDLQLSGQTGLRRWRLKQTSEVTTTDQCIVFSLFFFFNT